MNQDWDIRPCNSECSGCGKSFDDGELYYSALIHGEEGYCRTDHCVACKEKGDVGSSGSHSMWTGTYRPPPPPEAEVLEKHTAESLLRELIEEEDASKGNLIYVLAAMLERKKLLVEKSVTKSEDNTTTIVFEHRKTGESFLVTDPHLRLNELEHVQTEVAELLGGGRRPGASEHESSEPTVESGSGDQDDADTAQDQTI